MKYLILIGISISLFGCSKKHSGSPNEIESTQELKPASTASEFRQSVINFSKDVAMAADKPKFDSDTLVKDSLPPEIDSGVNEEPKSIKTTVGSSHKKKPSKFYATAHSLLPRDTTLRDSLMGHRPFLKSEIEAYVKEKYYKAKGLLESHSPEFLLELEAGQSLSKIGDFFLLKAKWEMELNKPEFAVVLCDQALRNGFLFEANGPRATSQIKCQALEIIKGIRPSEVADINASKARLKHNLLFSN